ncbi:MAG: DNA polymerase III subunit delta [Rickettsiales bacterium]|mgnify:CR=1 FL=1|nr:DNA polymerase III subunit delta [Rickettsiales bacterium]
MKLTTKQVDGFVAQPAQSCGVLLYGPDRGLIRQRLDQIAGHFLQDLQDPFNRADLGGDQLQDDPARLADELTAMSFTGGRRVVVIRDAGDKQAKIFQDAAEYLNAQNAYLIILSDDLSARSPLRKWAEADKAMAALPCYQDDGWSLEKLITQTLQGYGLQVKPDALRWMAQQLGGDRMIILSELEKLSLYMGEQTTVELSDVMAVTDASRERQLNEFCEAVASHHYAQAMNYYDRLRAEDVQDIAMLRILLTYFSRLQHLRQQVDAGESPAQAVKSFRPPIFFKQQDTLARQVGQWSGKMLDHMLHQLFEWEIALKSSASGLPVYLPQQLLFTLKRCQAAGR